MSKSKAMNSENKIIGGRGVFIHYISLPFGVKGVTLPNDDCTFDVYINSNLDETTQQVTLKNNLKDLLPS